VSDIGNILAKTSERPAFLLAGGRPRNEEAAVRMIECAFEGIRDPRVGYIGTANGDSEPFFEAMSELLLKAGAKDVVKACLAREDADVDDAKDIFLCSDVIFLAGGEVEDGMNWLNKHGLVEFLKDLHKEGKQFMGTSAGSIMMGLNWVRWDVEGDDDTSELFDCLGIIPAVFDTHGEDEDWRELKAALKLLGDGARGYGIPHSGAISADSAGTFINIEKTLLTFINDGGHIKQI